MRQGNHLNYDEKIESHAYAHSQRDIHAHIQTFVYSQRILKSQNSNDSITRHFKRSKRLEIQFSMDSCTTSTQQGRTQTQTHTH